MDSIAVLMGVAIGSGALVTIVLSAIYAKKSSAAALRITALEAEAKEHEQNMIDIADRGA